MMIKEELSKWLVENYDEMTLKTAIMYAENYLKYGVNVTEKWDTAVKQTYALEMARREGLVDGMRRGVVRCKDCINCVKEPNGELYCDILAVGYEPLGSKKVSKDWFCADGTYKENSNEQP